MITSLYTVLGKLNKEDKEDKKYLMVVNDTGVLLVEHGLFVISFDSEENFKKEFIYKSSNIKHIGDINI